jgi:hypothetical protein
MRTKRTQNNSSSCADHRTAMSSACNGVEPLTHPTTPALGAFANSSWRVLVFRLHHCDLQLARPTPAHRPASGCDRREKPSHKLSPLSTQHPEQGENSQADAPSGLRDRVRRGYSTVKLWHANLAESAESHWHCSSTGPSRDELSRHRDDAAIAPLRTRNCYIIFCVPERRTDLSSRNETMFTF